MSIRRSARTWAVLATGIVLSLATWGTSASLFAAGNDAAGTAVSDVGEVLVIAGAAGFVLWIASRWGRGDAVRRQWTLVGLAALAFLIGDIVWTYYEVALAVEPPYPGPPDVFYILMYGFLCFGIMWAGLAYRNAVSVRRPFVISAVLGTVLLGLVVAFVVVPSLAVEGAEAGELALGVIYPVADVVLLIGPALFVLLVTRGLGSGKLARPWMAVAGGTVLIALADSGYTLLQLTDTYRSGSPIDMGWMLGFTFVAMGASLAQDAFGV